MDWLRPIRPVESFLLGLIVRLVLEGDLRWVRHNTMESLILAQDER